MNKFSISEDRGFEATAALRHRGARRLFRLKFETRHISPRNSPYLHLLPP